MQYNIPKDKWLERGVNNHIYDPYCKKLMASYTNVISETGCRFWQCDNPCTYPYTVNTVSKGHHKSLPCSSKSLLLVFPLVHLDQPILCIGLVMFFFMTASRNVHPTEYLLYACLWCSLKEICWQWRRGSWAGMADAIQAKFNTTYLFTCMFITSHFQTLSETNCL